MRLYIYDFPTLAQTEKVAPLRDLRSAQAWKSRKLECTELRELSHIADFAQHVLLRTVRNDIEERNDTS